MSDTNQLLGLRIKELRKSRKLSQELLSERIGIDPKFLSRIEVGKGSPSLETLEKIAGELRVEIKELFEFTHLQDYRSEVHPIDEMLDGVGDDKKRLAIKVIKAIIN